MTKIFLAHELPIGRGFEWLNQNWQVLISPKYHSQGGIEKNGNLTIYNRDVLVNIGKKIFAEAQEGWGREFNLNFAEHKTVCMMFSTSSSWKKDFTSKLIMGTRELEFSSCTRYLGLKLTPSLDFNRHSKWYFVTTSINENHVPIVRTCKKYHRFEFSFLSYIKE